VVIGNGTSAVKFVAPGTTGNVLTSNGTAWLSQAAAAGGGDYIMVAYTSPATWTKPAGLKAVKVTVVGGGGNGGSGNNPGCGIIPGGGGGGGGAALRYIDAPAIPGPVSVTVGGAASTSSFGPFASATGGGNGTNAPSNTNSGVGGAGSGGTVNVSGGRGSPVSQGGASGFAFGLNRSPHPASNAEAGLLYGGGANGGGPGGSPSPGGAGAAGIVIVEEFY
jgi:hypothetical protein